MEPNKAGGINKMNDNEFFKDPVEKKEDTGAVELTDTETSSMKLQEPKPVFREPTKVKVTSAKFFKQETPQKDTNGVDYNGFSVTLSYQDQNNRTFNETYRGGRIYQDAEKGTSYYIGPASQLGKLKAASIESGLNANGSVKEWGEALTGKTVTLRAKTVEYQGKEYEKNVVIGISNE